MKKLCCIVLMLNALALADSVTVNNKTPAHIRIGYKKNYMIVVVDTLKPGEAKRITLPGNSFTVNPYGIRECQKTDANDVPYDDCGITYNNPVQFKEGDIVDINRVGYTNPGTWDIKKR